MRRHPVVPALAVQIDLRDALAHEKLQGDQSCEHRGIGEGKQPVDLHAQHDRIEDQRQKNLELAFNLVHQAVDGVEGLAGQERLDLLARMAVAQQGGEVAIVARKTRDVEAKGAHAGALGIDPAHRTGSIGCALDHQNPDQVVHQAIAAIGNIASGLDHQPRGGSRQQRLEHQEYKCGVEGPAHEKADEFELGKRLAARRFRGSWRGVPARVAGTVAALR